MASLNRVLLIGNLTRDPEHKVLASGQAVCRLGLAINRQFKNKQNGSMVQEVCFIDVDVWGPQAESCKQYLQKGRPVFIEGRLKYDSWEDQNGQTKTKHSIVADSVQFLSFKGSEIEDIPRTSPDASSTESIMQLNPNNPVERDLLNQLEQAKNKMQAAGKEKTSKKITNNPQPVSTGEIEFPDEPPFEDQLPF
ncbi:MAG TPA: single-stranded DNA-binding protein [Candidatus Babeliales bacterium]|jgi:single-strand DNA-binding protein|nr:single-stranded DNA-binding protein [Candidatus Babeliales bacterium]